MRYRAPGVQPFQGWECLLRALPRVATQDRGASQPWTVLCNPVGVGGGGACERRAASARGLRRGRFAAGLDGGSPGGSPDGNLLPEVRPRGRGGVPEGPGARRAGLVRTGRLLGKRYRGELAADAGGFLSAICDDVAEP